MNFDLLKKVFNWGMADTNSIKVFVPRTITQDQFKEITGEDYSTNQQTTQTNQGTTNQTNG